MKSLFLLFAFFIATNVYATDYLNVGDALYLDYYSDLEHEGSGVEVVVTEKTGEFMGGIQTYRVREVLTNDARELRMEMPLTDIEWGRGIYDGYNIDIRKSTQNYFYGRSRTQIPHMVTVGDTVSIFKESSNGWRLETGTLEVIYFNDIDKERPLYWYPNLHKLSILSNDQRITSSAQSLLADLAAVDAQNCVYVNGQAARLEEDSNSYPLCVGSRTTVGTVQKLYRSFVMGSNNDMNLFALVGDETTALYKISDKLPFDVYPKQ